MPKRRQRDASVLVLVQTSHDVNPIAHLHPGPDRNRCSHRTAVEWIGKGTEMLADFLRSGLHAVADYGQTFFHRLIAASPIVGIECPAQAAGGGGNLDQRGVGDGARWQTVWLLDAHFVGRKYLGPRAGSRGRSGARSSTATDRGRDATRGGLSVDQRSDGPLGSCPCRRTAFS